MGIVFDGVSSKSRQIHARLTSWQPVTAFRNNYVTVPGKPGAADFGCTNAERIIEVQCSIFPQPDFASLVGVLDGIAEWLNPGSGLKQLMFDEAPGRYYMARLSDAVDCERLIRSSGNFVLRFVCPDPHAYATADETFVISGAGVHTVTREKGNTDSEPVYYVCGIIPPHMELINYLSITTNGTETRLGTAIAGDLLWGWETLVIDSGKVTAKIVDTETGETLRNGLPLFSPSGFNFPSLKKGANTIEITAGGAAYFSELRIQAMSRWR